MTIYLTIITTVLVLTQIVRVLQNWKQLKRFEDRYDEYQMQIRVFEKLEEWLDERESL